MLKLNILMTTTTSISRFADTSSDVECCIGEMVVEVCGVLDCEEGFELWKEFQRKKVVRMKSVEAEHSDDDNNIHQ